MNKTNENKKSDKKFIVLDIVFYGSSLNYDWGGGTNYQPLKKITKWDGRQYALVSRYALRYSILHWANHLFPETWKLAGPEELVVREGGVAGLNEINQNVFAGFPEFDLFGFMITKEGQAALTRVSPVKISHAISLTPYNLDTHTMANLDMMKRAGGEGSNPVTIEEKPDFYIYNITIDVNRVGNFLKDEHGKEEIGDIKVGDEVIKERIIKFIETILNLKRDIKGRREDLSPWLIVLGLYNNGKYESYLNKIRLERKTQYKIKRKYKKDGDLEIIENEVEDNIIPSFNIALGENGENVSVFNRKELCSVYSKIDTKELNEKNVIEKVEKFLG